MVIKMEEKFIEDKMFELAKLIDYVPVDISFLKNAMHCQIIHKPGDGKNRRNYTNDSLATLGDAVLKLILTDYLFDEGMDKAEITKIKQTIENNDKLFGLRNESNILCYAYNDVYFFDEAPQENKVAHTKHEKYIEAIIAAIYKDKGFAYCKDWVIEFFTKNNYLTD